MITPRVETQRLVVDLLRDRLKTVDVSEQAEGADAPTWHGIQVVTKADLEAVEWQPLPPSTVHRAEILAPGRVAYTMVCPNCEQTVVIDLTLTTTLEWSAKGRKLKPKVEGSAVPHMCHQQALALDQAPGQVAATSEVLELMTQLDRLDSTDCPLHPTVATIAEWDEETRDEVATYAESVIRHRNEDDAILVPPMPEVLDDAGAPYVETLLLLVSSEVPGTLPALEQIRMWDRVTREAVADWAGAVYLKASDNPVAIPAMPEILAGESAGEPDTTWSTERPPCARAGCGHTGAHGGREHLGKCGGCSCPGYVPMAETGYEHLARRIQELGDGWTQYGPAPSLQTIESWPLDLYQEAMRFVDALEAIGKGGAAAKRVKLPAIRAAVFTAPEQLATAAASR